METQPDKIQEISTVEIAQITAILTEFTSKQNEYRQNLSGNIKSCLSQMFADSDQIDFYARQGNLGLVEVFYRLKNVIINKYFGDPLKNPHRENLVIEIINYLKSSGLVSIDGKYYDEYELDQTKFGSFEDKGEENNKKLTAICFEIIQEIDKIATSFRNRNNF